jgi:hypothetical protein
MIGHGQTSSNCQCCQWKGSWQSASAHSSTSLCCRAERYGCITSDALCCPSQAGQSQLGAVDLICDLLKISLRPCSALLLRAPAWKTARAMAGDKVEFPIARRAAKKNSRKQNRVYNAYMRRIVLIATLCLLLVPASAQMRSMAGSAIRGRPSPGVRASTMGNPAGRFSATSWGFHFHNGFTSQPVFHEHFHHHHHFFGGAWGYAYYGYPWFADYSYSPEQPYYSSRVDSAIYDQEARVEQRLDRIEERLNRFLDRLETVRPAPAQTTRPSEPEPAAALVFRDGHKEEIQNYAVVGHTLWVFTEDRARKVPLAQINTEATNIANEQRGIELHLPKRNEEE